MSELQSRELVTSKITDKQIKLMLYMSVHCDLKSTYLSYQDQELFCHSTASTSFDWCCNPLVPLHFSPSYVDTGEMSRSPLTTNGERKQCCMLINIDSCTAAICFEVTCMYTFINSMDIC